MQEEFWINKWANTEQGFHQEKVNSRLKKHWDKMGINTGGVFVPLCGMSIDMIWLRDRGFPVLGVEFSEVACLGFFQANNIQFVKSSDTRFDYYKGDNVTLCRGDYFSITRSNLESIHAVYDRAALIALPEDMRRRYANHMAEILESGDKIFLISMDYDESKMEGPPFSVTEEEVNDLFGYEFIVDRITHSAGPDIVGNLKKRGLDTLDEKIYIMERN